MQDTAIEMAKRIEFHETGNDNNIIEFMKAFCLKRVIK